MTSKSEIDEDYVAQLLVEDARKTSQKYSRQGLSSFLQDRQLGVPKPNTRFLNNIVRQADQHNTALKRKEEAESKLRLTALNQYDRPRKRRRTDEDLDHRRSRLFKDIADAANSTSRSHGRSGPRKSKENHTGRARHKQSDSTPNGDEEESYERRRKHKHSENSAERSDKPTIRGIIEPKKAEHRSKSKHHDERRAHTDRKLSSESSDPLGDVTDLLPALSKNPQIRGRGSKRQASNIDGHFSPNYDPGQDVTVSSDNEEDAWDMALEALRDRAKWKKNQAARLRDVGFNEHEISRWKTGALDKDKRSLDEQTDTLRWSRKGETREWDAGKVLD